MTFAIAKTTWRFSTSPDPDENGLFRSKEELPKYIRYCLKTKEFCYKRDSEEFLFAGHIQPSWEAEDHSFIGCCALRDETEITDRWNEIQKEEASFEGEASVIANGFVLCLPNNVFDNLPDTAYAKEHAVFDLFERLDSITDRNELTFCCERSYGASGRPNLHLHVIIRTRFYNHKGPQLIDQTLTELRQREAQIRLAIVDWAEELLSSPGE